MNPAYASTCSTKLKPARWFCGGAFSARELCRKHAISDATFYTWRKKYAVNGL
ncbi:hypothetical protein DP190_20845 [Enterobacter cloacae]|uniref:transposase n=1 Tax=Enterobacter sp. 148H3 TaxID=3077756 RepID=UPI000DCDD9FE|nr:hypothetical protein DP190_20845 [Enterobacter cloacae]